MHYIPRIPGLGYLPDLARNSRAEAQAAVIDYARQRSGRKLTWQTCRKMKIDIDSGTIVQPGQGNALLHGTVIIIANARCRRCGRAVWCYRVGSHRGAPDLEWCDDCGRMILRQCAAAIWSHVSPSMAYPLAAERLAAHIHRLGDQFHD